MVHLIGTSHKFQVVGTSPNAEFLTYLLGAVTALEATVVAEELSADGERIVGGPNGRSVASIVAERCAIKHVFCDPDRKEREQLGLKSDAEIERIAMSAWFATDEDPNAVADRERRKDFPIREGIWLERLRPFLAELSIVFVCGAGHIDTFGPRLAAEGVEMAVCCRDWFPDTAS
jgi:hypothetical protein